MSMKRTIGRVGDPRHHRGTPARFQQPAVCYSKIEVPNDDRRTHRINVIRSFFGSFGAFWAPQVVLFQGGKRRFVLHHVKVVQLKIVV
jgi:hypothetical protein